MTNKGARLSTCKTLRLVCEYCLLPISVEPDGTPVHTTPDQPNTGSFMCHNPNDHNCDCCS